MSVKKPKKNYLTENPTERYWTEKKKLSSNLWKSNHFSFLWPAHLSLIISEVRRTYFFPPYFCQTSYRLARVLWEWIWNDQDTRFQYMAVDHRTELDYQSQNRHEWRYLVNKAMTLRVPNKARNFFNSRGTTSLLRKTAPWNFLAVDFYAMMIFLTSLYIFHNEAEILGKSIYIFTSYTTLI
jgi:hypothetical protein